MSQIECGDAATVGIDWGDSEDGGSWWACAVHLSDVMNFMALDDPLVRRSGYCSEGKTCPWLPTMSPEAVAAERDARAAALGVARIERGKRWVADGCVGSPVPVERLRAALTDDELAALYTYVWAMALAVE